MIYLLGNSVVECSYYTCSSIKSSVHKPQQRTQLRDKQQQQYKFNNNNNNQTLSENSKANLVNFLNKIKSKEPEGGENIRDCF